MNEKDALAKDLVRALDAAWNAGGTPEMAMIFVDGEWVTVDLRKDKEAA